MPATEPRSHEATKGGTAKLRLGSGGVFGAKGIDRSLALPALMGAFSLIEMMIAIVLLGMGMIMIATMFPVAWTRARQLSDMTSLSAVTESADATLRQLARVDGLEAHGSTFPGDLVFLREDEFMCTGLAAGNPGCFVSTSDTRVHAMTLENLSVGAMRRFVPDYPRDRVDVDYHTYEPLVDWTNEFASVMFTDPQVRFESRVHPPMRPPLSRDFTKADPFWDETLDGRRYAWAVLSRLRSPVEPTGFDRFNLGDDPDFPEEHRGLDHNNDRRDFDLYYVMLRRPQATNRYAQQDPRSAPNPFDDDPLPVAPKALPPNKDVVLPVAWRVQLFFRGPFNTVANATGVPSEVEANPQGPGDPATSALVLDLFPVGASFIDEVTGSIYRVTARRIVGTNQDHAYLTLDREVLVEKDLIPGACDPTLPLCSLHRTVWVFPPPVQAARKGPLGAEPIFDGPQPVVGIDVRSLSLPPTR